MNRLDDILQSTCPTVMVPRHDSLLPLVADGHRFLAAADGLHLEMRRPWLHLRLPVAESSIALPYGTVEPLVRLRFDGGQLADLIGRFIAEARDACPREHAAWLMFDTESGTLEYEAAEILEAGAGHIRYRRPMPTLQRVPAIDLHSHGRFGAFFSGQDDRDDRDDDAKLAVVVGNLDGGRVSLVARLSVLGRTVGYSEWLSELLVAHGHNVLVSTATEDSES